MKNINESFDDIPEKYRSSDEVEHFISEFENFEEYCMMSGKSSIFRNTVSDFLKNEGISPSEISWSGDYPEKLGIDKAKEMLKAVKDAVYGKPINKGLEEPVYISIYVNKNNGAVVLNSDEYGKLTYLPDDYETRKDTVERAVKEYVDEFNIVDYEVLNLNEGCGKKSKKRNSLKEGITDYIPRGGLFRNSEDKPIGAYFGQGTKDQLKKAKIIARVKAYEAEPGKKFMAGRVSSDDLKNYDEYARKYEEYFGEIVDEGFNKKSLKESVNDSKTKYSIQEVLDFLKKILPSSYRQGEMGFGNGIVSIAFTTRNDKIYQSDVDEIEYQIRKKYGNTIKTGVGEQTWGGGQQFYVEFYHADDDKWTNNYLYESFKNKKSLKELLEDFESENPEIEAFIEEEPTNNPEDCVSMNIPLLMRVLEFAKEDASSDEQLHDVVERMIEMSKNGQILSMDDYDSIIESAPVNEEPAIETEEEIVYDAESPFDEIENDYSDNTMSDEEWLRSYGW